LNGFREIEATLRISISTRLIIGCAALFVDERKSCGKENLSIAALLDRSDSQVTNATIQIWNEITDIVNKMNLKDFRNKRLAHFDYDVLMGNRKIEAVVRSDKLSELLGLTEDLLHQLSSDISYNDGAKSFFYSKIDSAHSPQEFLRRISRSAR
jgi:hypothetical protein